MLLTPSCVHNVDNPSNNFFFSSPNQLDRGGNGVLFIEGGFGGKCQVVSFTERLVEVEVHFYAYSFVFVCLQMRII